MRESESSMFDFGDGESMSRDTEKTGKLDFDFMCFISFRILNEMSHIYIHFREKQ